MKNNFYSSENLKCLVLSLTLLFTLSSTVHAQVPTASVSSDTTCFGAATTLTLANAVGTIQWQSNIGAGWVNETNPGFDSSVYVVMPTQDIDYRAYLVGTADTSNIISIHVIMVAPPTNTTTDSIRCGIGPVTLTASGSGELLWYETPTAMEFIHQGDTFMPFINNTTTYYAANTDSASGASGGGSGLLITEINVGTPADLLEIQNVSAAPIDVTGWTVAISNSYADINSVNTTVQTLSGIMLPGDIMAWVDATVTPPLPLWGSNMLWNPGNFPTFTGWAIILDDVGEIVDFVPMEWPAANIQAMNATIAGFNVTIGTEWVGDGVDHGTLPGGSSLNRQGNSDNNDLNDFVELPDNGNTTNPGLVLPFPGGVCESPRIAITAYSTAPPIVTATTSSLAICQTDTVTISLSSSNPNYVYTWSPSTFLDVTVGPNVISLPTTTITYVMLATDSVADCVTSDTFLVDVGIIPSAGIAVAPVDTVCVGATTAISVTSSVGNLQWQIDDGTGWANLTGAGSDSTTYTFMPSATADYRAVASSGGCPNDTSNTVNIAVINVTDPTAFDTVRCGPGNVNMYATGIGQQVWYDSPVGGTRLGIGSVISLNVQNTDTFYVESNVGTLCNAGEANNAIGNSSIFTSPTQNWGLQFSVSQPIYIDRVHIYVGNTGGNITVNLRDAIGGSILQTATFAVPANVALYPLDLAWFVPNGTGFALELEANPNVDLIYNTTGASYPIISAGCPVTITGYFNPNLNTFDDYHYFYNWEISDGCKTNRFPAIATVLPLPAKPNITQNANTLTTSSSAPTYQWYQNGTLIPGATSQTYVVTQLGDYQVEIGSANGCTEISNIYTITIISPPGIDEGAEEIDLQVFPNPTKNIFSVSFELEETANVKIILRNALGQDVILMEELKRRGKYESKTDISKYKDGIYLLEIQVDDSSFNRKLIIAR